MEMTLSIRELLQGHSLPFVVKARLNTAEKQFLHKTVSTEIVEVFIQGIVRVKYAHVNFIGSVHDTEKSLDRKCDDNETKQNKFVNNQYLIPVKYSGKVKFSQRPGSSRRYVSVAQVLEDAPRYITIWEHTPAFICSPEGEPVSVPPESTLEVLRKVICTVTNIVYLECSDGPTIFAFVASNRLNCTAVDDIKEYNLFELVRMKMLPRVIQFQPVHVDEITHLDNTVCEAVASAMKEKVELHGFVDRELLIGWVRNEQRQCYETVLIPQGLWASLFVEKESFNSRAETSLYIRHLYGPCDSAKFVENSLYLMPLQQNETVRLLGPDFRGGNKFISDFSYLQLIGKQNPGPVVLLPQVRRKRSLFQKVHAELLRLFSSSKRDESHQQTHKESKKVISPTSKVRKWVNDEHAKNQFSRSVSLRDIRSESNNLKCMRINYGTAASYLEFCTDYQEGLSPVKQQQVNGRLSKSMDDITRQVVLRTDLLENKRFRDSSPSKHLSCVYSEIVDRQTSVEEFEECDEVFLQGACEENYYVPEQPRSVSITRRVNSQRNVSSPRVLPAVRPLSRHTTINTFYNYTVDETAACLRSCGLQDFAEQCREQKLDGAFFRNFDLDIFKGEPFRMSNFTILKLKKIIQEDWRPS